jgi:hypothetical protein
MYLSSVDNFGAASLSVSAPVALAAIAAPLGADARTLRRICLALATFGAAFFLLMAAASFPLIVPADSDLGVGAMARSGDCMHFCGECIAIAALTVIGNYTNRTKARLALAVPLLFFVVTQEIESPGTPAAARTGVAALIGILIAIDGLPALAKLLPARSPLVNIGWMLAVPALVLLTDWNARYYLFAIERERINRWDVVPSCAPLVTLLVLDVAFLAWVSLHDEQKRT